MNWPVIFAAAVVLILILGLGISKGLSLFRKPTLRNLSFEPVSDVVLSYDEEEWSWVEQRLSQFEGLESSRVKNNPGLTHFLFTYSQGTVAETPAARLTQKEMKTNIPLLLQWDARWGTHDYGDDVMALTGCGPTCMAMVISGLTGDPAVTPPLLADFAIENDYYLYGTGTKWDFLPAVAEAYGLECRQMGTGESTIRQELKRGHVVVVSVGSGHFTAHGHFLVIASLENGYFVINDPNNVENSRHFWRYENFGNDVGAAWCFSVP